MNKTPILLVVPPALVGCFSLHYSLPLSTLTHKGSGLLSGNPLIKNLQRVVKNWNQHAEAAEDDER